MRVLQRIKSWFLWATIPFQKWIQRRGRREPVITDTDAALIISSAKPGDILLSFEFQRYTSGFIKGEYDHAVIVGPSGGTVVEAVGDLWKDGKNLGGVREVGLIKWVCNKDRVVLIRPVIPDNPGANVVAAYMAQKQVGKGYDYLFRKGDDTIYCSELEYLGYVTSWDGFLADIEGEILPQVYRDKCGNGYLVLIAESAPVK